MSADTRAYLQGKIEPEEIARCLCYYYDIDIRDIKIDHRTFDDIPLTENLQKILIHNYSTNQDFWHTEISSINFVTPEGNYRTIMRVYDDCVFENDKVFKKESNIPFTSISLFCDEQGKDIIKAITSYFGGYMDENDCDDIGYVPIPKSHSQNENEANNGVIKPIFYFTIEELQEHFGGFVKIVSKEEKEKLIQKKIEMKRMTPSPPPDAPPLRTLTEGFKRDNN